MAFDAPIADRRQFLTWSAGGAFLLAVAGPATAQRGVVVRVDEASPWFEIQADGRVKVYSTAVEMGQGSHTGHAAIIADELDVPWNMIDVEMADIVKYNNRISTGGSRSIVATYDTARTAGATARAQFMQAAAEQWNVSVDQVDTAGGKVVNKMTNAELSYGELASAAGQIAPPTDVAFRAPSTRACIGVPQPTKGLRERVTGTEVYGIDTRVPGMKRAGVKQAPVFGATLASVDHAPAMAIPGVRKVIELESAVAVVADDTWTAFKAVAALDPQWNMPDMRKSTDGIKAELRAATDEVASANPLSGDRVVSQAYELTHVAHVTMEPQNTVAHVTNGRVEIWAPTQVPASVQRAAAGWAGQPDAEVILHTTMLGGGFGRRLAVDFIELGVKIAAQYDGPVQMVWTREEDFTHDPYRRATRQLYRTALDSDGMISGYECIHIASDGGTRSGMGEAPYEAMGEATITAAGSRGVVPAGIPSGFWRSVDEGISTWGRESFVDECAIAAGKDPLQYRMALLGDNERAKRLLAKVAEEIGYSRERPAGTGVGVAVGEGFGSLYAHAIEVEVGAGKQLKVNRVVIAADLGTIVAPNQVHGQFQGGSLMALGAALYEAQTFTDGAADVDNFHAYDVMRMAKAPQIEVHLFESPEARIGGSGEPPMPTLAPALANAIFNASGERPRSLPLAREGYTVV